MPHPYDASTKYLVQRRLADWLPLSGRTTTAPVEIIDADQEPSLQIPRWKKAAFAEACRQAGVEFVSLQEQFAGDSDSYAAVYADRRYDDHYGPRGTEPSAAGLAPVIRQALLQPAEAGEP